MRTVEFASAKFLPFLPEECQANPGVYGFELALWLSQTLAKAGIVTSYPLGEDWGWLIEYIDGESEITIGCSSVAAESEGYTGAPILWRVFVTQPRSLLKRLKAQAPSETVARIFTAVQRALAAEGLSVHETEA